MHGRATRSSRAASASRKADAKAWHAALAETDPAAPADEAVAARLADLFKDYLRATRADPHALSTLPPGRFLMPGDLEGSPALTFAPLDAKGGESFPRGSLWAMMARRYEAYKTHVVRPFFRDHFARLDRQIVLIDVLAALNGGQPAVADLERAMAEILECFRTGANSLWSSLFAPRIDRIVFAATKADHLHHKSHDRLEAILAALTEQAMARAKYAGAEVKALALAAIRATREGNAKRNGEALPCIVGYPLPGETIGRRQFDGSEAFAIFPGDLPADPEAALRNPHAQPDDVRFVRFRPPDPVLLPSGGYRTVPKYPAGPRDPGADRRSIEMTKPRKPASFRLEEIEVVEAPLPPPSIATDAIQLPATVRALPGLERGWRWGSILLAAVGGLVALASAVWLHDLVRAMMARQDWIGWATIGLLGLADPRTRDDHPARGGGARSPRPARPPTPRGGQRRGGRRQGARAGRARPAEAALSRPQGSRLGHGAPRRA